MLYADELVIDDEYEVKHRDDLMLPARGYDPDTVDKRGIFGAADGTSPPAEITLIPRSEWSDRIREKEKAGAQLSQILRRSGIPSTDQNGHGYCWAYSTVGCVQMIRCFNGQKHVPLNAHSVASIIKNGADQGGWCGLSCRFLNENGVAPMGNGPGEWPEHSRDFRRYRESCRESMSKYRLSEAYIDLARADYDQDMTFDQVASCLLANIPCALDFNWWGHSVMGVDLVEPESGSFGIRIRNSWTDRWGDKGFSVLTGSKRIPNNAVAIRSMALAG